MEPCFGTGLLSKTVFIVVVAWIGMPSVVLTESHNHHNHNNHNLQLVQMLFRHGARAPITSSYPNDPNPDDVWPEGFGMLTQLGKRQHYTLGKFLRSFYSGYITSDPNEVFVNSTDDERCMKSALSNLASFYAPSSRKFVVDNFFPWQPINVHYKDKAVDKYLGVETDCPRLNQERGQNYNSSDFQAEVAKHKDLFDALKKYAGYPSVSWYDAFMFQDVLITEKKHGFVIPEWVDPYLDEINEFGDLIFEMMYKTKEILRLGVGPLLGEMVEKMDNKIKDANNTLKVQVYSAHDANILAVLQALDLYDRSLRPPFASCLLVELHNTHTGPAVRLLYLKSTTPEHLRTIHPHLLKLKGCGEFCPLETFREIVQPFVPDDWEKECQTLD